MGKIFDTVVAFLKKNEYYFSQIPNEPILRLDVWGKNGRWTCYAHAKEDQEQFIFYSIYPVNVPEYKLHEMAEFITRANYGLTIGNFELDFSDGEIRYKTSIDVEGDRLSEALLKQLVYANLTIADRYLPGVMAVCFGDMPPAKAIMKVEAPDNVEMLERPDIKDFDA